MHVIRATQQMLETRTLVLGFQGENLRTQLRIDCASTFAEYPNATPALAIKPPSGETYPVFVDRDGTEVVWDIVANNLALKGDGELQLTFYKDNVIAKTSVGHITVNRSLQIDGEMPDVVATWIENANRKLAEVDAQIVELEGMVDTATDAATRAEQSASTASTKAEQAAGSAATATAKATESTNAAGTATAKAAEAEQSAQTATEKATAAAESERIATAKAGDATTAAGTATAKAEQATEAAQTATEKAGDASTSARAAQASATDAASSATAASASETAAKASETAAGASAMQAATSAQTAGTAAQTATQKAADASASATNAATSATNAATSAETASTKAGEAAQSAQAVAETAEQLADSLEQIEQNTQDIAELDERKANIDGYYPDMTVGNAEQLNSSKFVENSEPYMLRTSGGNSDIGNREYLDAVVGGTLAWNQKVRDEASENSTDFADVVTVTDAVEDAAGVKVKIEPVQDLHGYDHPWPAGGGVNLLDPFIYDQVGNRYTANADGTITASISDGGDWNDRPVVPLKAGTYTVSYSATSGALRYKTSEDNYTEEFVTAVSKTFTLTADGGIKFKFGLGASAYPITVKVQLESGSTATAWTPYSNICPITGWDGVKVSRTGKNLCGGLDLARAFERVAYPQQFSIDTTTKTFTFTRAKPFDGGYVGSIFTPKNKARMTVFVTYSNTVYNNSIRIIYTDGTYTEADLNSTNGEKTTYRLVTSENKQVERITLNYYSNGSTTVYYDESGFFEGVVESDDFESYSGQTYDITLPTEAGTVYGGELTVNADGSGSLVVDRAEVDAGSLNWSVTNTHCFYSQAIQATKEPNLPSDIPNLICSAYRTDSPSRAYNGNTGDCVSVGISGIVGAKRIVVYSSSNTDPTTFKASMSGVQLVYELETPITYTLTPTEIRTLLGQNNIWADTGDLALTYTGTDEHLTLESGKKYLSRISGTDSMLLGSGQEITAVKGTDNVFDLTQMFGTAVADYVYGQGAAFFRKWFGKQWYPYNAGELKHVEGLSAHEMVGFNAFDKNNIENGVYISDTDGHTLPSTGAISTGWIPVIGGATYYIKHNATSGNWGAWYDADKAYISGTGKGLRTAPVNAAYLRFTVKNNASSLGSPDTLCISLAHNGSRNGEYEPYEKHSYPLDSSVILRGIPKVGANGVYWDGDRYLPDGTVERLYGVVDLGTLSYEKNANRFLARTGLANAPSENNSTSGVAVAMLADSRYVNVKWGLIESTQYTYGLMAQQIMIGSPDYADKTIEEFKAAMSGVYLVYELATPTTESAQPYHSTQWVSDWGTEEFVSTGIVPVGTETRYPANLRDKLQHLPDAASGNGSYLITQTDGQMVLTPFPVPPSNAGNYVLKATVVNGVATYTWEVAT